MVDAADPARNATPRSSGPASATSRLTAAGRGDQTDLVRTLTRALAALAAAAVGLLALPPAAAPDRTSEALVLLSDVVAGRDSAVVDRFDERMRASLSSEGLRAAWATYEQAFGRYVGHGAPQSSTLGAYTVVQVPLTMSVRGGEFRISFAADGSIAGLYFLRRGVPL
jgi:hypothetical protein